MTITVPASRLVERLLGRRIRVEAEGFNGYGEVITVFGHINDHEDFEEHVAEVRLEVSDGPESA